MTSIFEKARTSYRNLSGRLRCDRHPHQLSENGREPWYFYEALRPDIASYALNQSQFATSSSFYSSVSGNLTNRGNFQDFFEPVHLIALFQHHTIPPNHDQSLQANLEMLVCDSLKA